MKQKVVSLIEVGRPVRIVHPIPVDKWIVKIDDDGTVLSRRRSPKHGEPTDVFGELVSFPELLAEAGLEVDVIMTIEEEVWLHAADGPWRRRGWGVVERRLIEVVDSLLLKNTEDLTRLLPESLPERFTTGDLAEKLRRPRRSAQQMAYCLRKLGVLEAVGRRGNTVEYQVASHH